MRYRHQFDALLARLHYLFAFLFYLIALKLATMLENE